MSKRSLRFFLAFLRLDRKFSKRSLHSSYWVIYAKFATSFLAAFFHLPIYSSQIYLLHLSILYSCCKLLSCERIFSKE